MIHVMLDNITFGSWEKRYKKSSEVTIYDHIAKKGEAS